MPVVRGGAMPPEGEWEGVSPTSLPRGMDPDILLQYAVSGEGPDIPGTVKDRDGSAQQGSYDSLC